MPFDMKNVSDPLDVFEPVEEKPPEVPPATAASAQQIEQKVDQLGQNLQAGTLLNQLLAVPEVQQILQARQSGQAIRVVPADQAAQQQQAAPPEEPDWEKLKEDPKKMTEHLLGHLSADLGKQLQGMVSKSLEPIQQQIQQLSTATSEQQGETAAQKLADAKKKYADFDQFVPKMRELNSQTKGLSIDDLYYLAKARSGSLPVTQKEVGTERPIDAASKQSIHKKKQTFQSGRAGFEQAIGSALDSYLDENDLGDFLNTP